ncbi:IS3 family transposase [Clostridium botulinum]|nr:IS3 family transposase [Clostridium botulinum]
MFYKTIKRKLIQYIKYQTPEQAQKEIFKYIQLYYKKREFILYWVIVYLSNLKI